MSPLVGYPGDEEPTKPDAAGNPSALMIARLFDQLAPIDQRNLARLVECWFTANTDERILLEQLAARLARRRPP